MSEKEKDVFLSVSSRGLSDVQREEVLLQLHKDFKGSAGIGWYEGEACDNKDEIVFRVSSSDLLNKSGSYGIEGVRKLTEILDRAAVLVVQERMDPQWGPKVSRKPSTIPSKGL